MNKRMLLLCFVVFLAAGITAQITVRGKVTDGEGAPVPGVNILVKGTNNGAVTNTDGVYQLSDVFPDDVLVFSFVGMLTEEIIAGSRTVIDVTLAQDILDMEGVVVIGYGTVKKKDLTGSVATISNEEIIKLPTSNAIEAIQGKVTGMDIVRESGSAGSGVYIRVRGNRSIGNPNEPDKFDDLNEPLYVIDGIQGASFSDLNPNDIESINVLKDASSTAIYGSQGANGVIIITTKKGKEGKTRVSYNGFYGITGLTPYPKVRMGDEYIQFRKDAYSNAGAWNDSVHTEDDYRILFNEGELAAIDSGQWVDWQDLIMQNGSQNSHQISVSGGNEKTRSYFSAGYYNEEGIVKLDEFKRYNARVNIDHTLNRWFLAGIQSQLTYIDQDRRKDPLSTASSITPLGIPYNENGSINLYPVAGNATQISPLTDERTDIAIDNTRQTKVLTLGYVEIRPFNGLTFRSNLGANLQFSRRGIFNDATSLSQKGLLINNSSVNASNGRFINWDNILTYSKSLGRHNMVVTALTSYTQNKVDEIYASGDNQATEAALFYNLGATDAEGREISSAYVGSASMSYAARIFYSFADKYLITLTERIDGASRLAEENRWDHFPSFAVAWKIKEENFLQNIDWINDMKIRYSYGIAGNSGISEYGTQSGIWPFSIGFGEVAKTGYKFNTLVGNATLGWEKSATHDIGIDITLFSNRVNATIDVYNTNTSDILLQRQLPKMSGVGSVFQNIGSTQNRGIELNLQTINLNKSDFTWSSVFTFSKNKEKITGLIDGTDIINNEDNSLVLGYPIKSFYTFKKTGIWQLGDEAEMAQIRNIKYKAGDIRVENLNADTLIDAEDRTVIGSAVPKWVGGFENTFSYKNINLSIFLFARMGQMIKAEFLGRYNPSGSGNGPDYFDYWMPDNPTNEFPRPLRGAELSNYFGYQTLTYVDGSYFKIKNIRLSYTLPPEIAGKLLAERLQLYATASNILTLTKSHLLKYYDPERGGSESAPLSRQIVFGINVDF